MINKGRALLVIILGIRAVADAAGAPVPPLETARPGLSASFGEYRPGHLHAGIDLATFGKTGLPVTAVEAGRVIRVRSSVGGYGNVIYLQHADGHRTVYAHLESFSPKIAALLPSPAHPLGGDFSDDAMQVYPAENIRVEKGEIIGRSGESGAGSPHLHFELRDADDRPLNSVSEGMLSINDAVPPVISSVILEPFDENATVEGGIFPVEIKIRGKTIGATGRLRILLNGSDEDGSGGGVLGLSRIRLLINSVEHATIAMNRFSYGPDKEVGLVYDLYRTGFGPPNYAYDLTGPANAAEVLSGKGPVEVTPHNLHVQVEAYDLNDNCDSFSFTIARSSEKTSRRKENAEHISRAGIAVRRHGLETRIATVVENSRARILYANPTGITSIARNVKISGIPPRQKVASYSDPSLRPPPYAVGRPILLGPYGLPLSGGAEITIESPKAANGIAIWRNGSWSWLGGTIIGNQEAGRRLISAGISFLAPVVLARDTVAPAARIVYESDLPGPAVPVVTVTDDLSGVDGDRVVVHEIDSAGKSTLRQGRFDSDRGRFVPHVSFSSDRLSIETADRAGNVSRTTLRLRRS